MRGSSSLQYHRLGFLKALGKTAMTSDGVLGEVHHCTMLDRAPAGGATAGTRLSRDNARHHVHCLHHIVILLSDVLMVSTLGSRVVTRYFRLQIRTAFHLLT
ncbi:hypothetical protein HBI42_104650 [Parastagonospora nodorum]|nr:hypothetical protein HBH51_067320 [Parastagonospora nodorum]KAH4066834.1 hypothetical protein HBH50_143690 [Parastagonospora nodorum]KAH4086104.1 hypothetical protein HBH48_146310 [Parastagonospora nodorum]KAH4120241.1 hypothetical protein HBH47_117760 [Parastagonospora nodorum]KAH5183722.1 hypothetical protein HBH76_142090 [Parastagonospora nodorum]